MLERAYGLIASPIRRVQALSDIHNSAASGLAIARVAVKRADVVNGSGGAYAGTVSAGALGMIMIERSWQRRAW